MASPAILRRLDDRFLRRRPAGGDETAAGGGDGLRSFLGVFARVSALVLTVLALVLVAAVVLVVAPTNESNVLVRWVLDAADQVAGPFATVFDISGRAARAAANYGLGAAVYLLLAKVVTRVAPSP